ncbi:MAG: alanine racemase [Candidatus Eremiobacteraeota bacterium]|nr:alanine racemase [Candidatus Eremiobacteraeota bacterium]
MIRAELTIDLAAIRGNVGRIGAFAAPARYGAVVKANAYGHGLVPVALALADRVAAFCVYRAAEAVELRDAGVTTPILVLGPLSASELAAAHEAQAAIALWSVGSFREDVTRLAARSGRAVPVHAKIDTGVARLGLDIASAPAAIASYLADPALAFAGIFTHLAAAEELESAYTLGQLERFARCLSPFSKTLAQRGALRHAAASAAAMLFPKLRLDMIRAGIATYGVWPSEETRHAASHALELKPALRWTTDLVVVRDVEAGSSVGYGCTFRAARPSRIGVLPIGYAEGVPRALSNAGFALVCGRRVPFVGRVCMNMAFVDVTDVPLAAPGARVTLIGRDGEACIEANELAEAAGSIGYELLARLPSEIPRRYVHGIRDDENAATASARSIVPS